MCINTIRTISQVHRWILSLVLSNPTYPPTMSDSLYHSEPLLCIRMSCSDNLKCDKVLLTRATPPTFTTGHPNALREPFLTLGRC